MDNQLILRDSVLGAIIVLLPVGVNLTLADKFIPGLIIIGLSVGLLVLRMVLKNKS
jgi:hypothetical protein